jgi:hypothetical protein
MLDSPRLIHCFAVDVASNPSLARTGPSLEVDYLIKDRRVPAGEPVAVSFRLIDPETREPRLGLADVEVSYVSPGREKRFAAVREVGDGVYEATVSASDAGAYYIYVAVPSAKIKVGDLTFLSLIAEAKEGSRARRWVR